jgi:hypothetical protein
LVDCKPQYPYIAPRIAKRGARLRPQPKSRDGRPDRGGMDRAYARVRPGDQLLVRPGPARAGRTLPQTSDSNGGGRSAPGSDGTSSQVLEVDSIRNDEDGSIELNVTLVQAGQGEVAFSASDFDQRFDEPVNMLTVLVLSTLCAAGIWAILALSI